MSGHVLTFGETMGLVRTIELGDLADVDMARIATGGADSNVAIGLSRLGIEVVWLGRVGADSIGRRVLRDILGQAVDVRAIVDPDAPTGLMLKEKRTPHTTRVWYYRSGSAGSRLQPEDIDPALVESAALVHVTGITASISASGLETVRHVLRIAHKADVPVSFDVNHRASLWRVGNPAPVYREIAASAQLLFAGDDEAALLTGVPEEETERLLTSLKELGPTVAVLKRGAKGSLARIGEHLFECPALQVPVVDTVGAGDAFVAAFLAAHLRLEAMEVCLQRATEAGAFACMGMGDWESMPRPEDLALLENSDPVAR